MTGAVIDLDAPATWPPAVRTFLDDHYDLFLDWATGPTRFDARTYDRAIYGLFERLRPFAIVGWHSTRLTANEVAAILAQGMQPPDPAMLDRRIDAVIATGDLTPELAARLKAKNQAHETYRAGRIWFCFYPPREAGEGGIADLLSHWGGEALYNSHDRDPVMGPILRSIGRPCLVEAVVPVDMLEVTGLPFTVVARFLNTRGLATRDHVNYEDRVLQPLPASSIRRVIRFPEPDFLTLTACEPWIDRLSGLGGGSESGKGLLRDS